ncbi:MAG TPA: PAS domain S-box protein [Gallionella sp.]|nr:PAS domain S-box protein [Gallionella sp.]
MLDSLPSMTLIPHGYCISWQPGLIAALVIGNLAIALAYFTIPLVILKFIRQRSDIDFKHLHWLFAGFIVTCGVTHLLHVVELWYPVYYLEAAMDMLTALVSIIAAVVLWRILPVIVSLPSSNQLRAANEELRQVGTELQDREVQLRNLGDSLPDSFLYQYTLENDRPRFLYISSGVERLNGIKAEVVMQDAMALLGQIAPEQRDRYAETQTASQRDMSNFAMDLHMLRADGEWRWIQVKSRPRRNNNDRVVWDGIATDITDRHLFESEINRLAQAIEQNPTGILITDHQGALEYMNAACTRISGYQFAEAYAKNRTPREIISSEMSDAEYGAVQTQLQSGRTWSGVLRNRRKDGSIYWEQMTVSPIYSNEGKLASYLYLRSDVTEQRNAEAALTLRSTALERAHADLTRFADVSAHHLMEPTRRLASYAQQLRARSSALPEACHDEEMLSSLAYIEQDAARLRSLVRDVQLYLAAGTPRDEVRMEDSNAVLNALKLRMAEQLESRHVSLEFGALPQAMLDRPRLTDLFTVLLDNALRHGQPVYPDVAAQIRITGEREDGLSRFRVMDNGGGIPVEYLERVFEIFERLSVTNSGGGTGIGLSIARRIVESRHGNIWIENLPEGGAMVVFELPDGADHAE